MEIKHIYAFDDCSILKLCEIKIPNSHQIFFDKKILATKHHSKLKIAIQKLDNYKVHKYRFVPSENIEQNIIKVANQILEGYNIQMLGNMFKSEIVEQLEYFNEKIVEDFEEIPKNDDIDKIKEIFVNSERELTKERNIPEDDDFKIIAGYYKFDCKGNKYLITEDEHFWGYSDLISENFKIYIVEEWKCHLITV